jgi:sulfide:quinone oxidoreductase
MFGHVPEAAVRHPNRDLLKPGVRFVQSTIRSIDPTAKRVTTDGETFDADVLVVALGADLDPAATPGLVEGGHEFYTEPGAFALRDVLAGFEGGRVVVAVTSTPFKCPPAPSEAVLMLHDFLTARGVRDSSEIALVMPVPVPIPPSPEASKVLIGAFAEREISFHANTVVQGLDPERTVALLADGGEMPYDLFLGVPKHVAPPVVVEAGLTADGWIPVDPATLETSFPGVYAVGDCTSIGTPKAGVFSEGQAGVVADAIVARARGGTTASRYDGHGVCYLEFGGGAVAKVDVVFRSGEAPRGVFGPASTVNAAEKEKFGRDRIRRWFNRDWTP